MRASTLKLCGRALGFRWYDSVAGKLVTLHDEGNNLNRVQNSLL